MTKTDMLQLDGYETFRNLGKYCLAPVVHNKIQVYLVYDVNHGGRHKARLVSYEHLTDITVKSAYYEGFYLHVIRLLVFLAGINEI